MRTIFTKHLQNLENPLIRDLQTGDTPKVTAVADKLYKRRLDYEKDKTDSECLVITAMATSFASASEEARENPQLGLIERHDQDGDGKVSKMEFHGQDEHFTRIDLDSDGFINQQEALKAPRPKGQRGRLLGKFTEDDADGNGVVSRAEFSGPADHFDRLDLNGDGAIEENEARQGPPGMA